MNELSIEMLEEINGGRRYGRVVEATCGAVLVGNSIAIAAAAPTGGISLAVAAVATGIGVLIDSCN